MPLHTQAGNGGTLIEQILNGLLVVVLVGDILAVVAEDVVVIEVQRSCGEIAAGGLEPLDHDVIAAEIHEVVVGVRLVDDVPLLDQPLGGLGDLVYMVDDERGNGRGCVGLVGQIADALGQIAPARPDQDVAAPVKTMVLELGKSGQRLCATEIGLAPVAIPRRPFEGIFVGGGVEEFLDLSAIGLVFGRLAGQPPHLEGRAKEEGVALHSDFDGGIGHWLASRVDDLQREIALAVLPDAFLSTVSPSGVRGATGVGQAGLGQVVHG